MYNLNYAFEVAEKELDIPKMLDAEGNLFWQKRCNFFLLEKRTFWSFLANWILVDIRVNTSVDFWAVVSLFMV